MAAAARARVGVDAHNRVLAEGRKRAERLEPRLAAILRPILARAGEQAASRFARHAHAGVQASALRASDRAALARSDLSPADLAGLARSLEIRAAGPLQGVERTSTMVAVKPRPAEAEAVADPDGAPPEGLHVTLAYLGEVEGTLEPVLAALRAVAAQHAPLEGVVGGYGEFRPPGCGILLPDVPGLVELRVAVTEALAAAQVGYGRDHGFTPHMTVDGSPEDGEIDLMLERAAGKPLHFDELLVVRGDAEVHAIPFTGVLPVTAAGVPGEPPRWRKPAGDELVNVDQLVSTLRTKTDPVRMAVVRSTMGRSLEQAGIAFDATNPLTAKVLAQSGSQIKEIADTTRLNVMRIVGRSYNEGLSIPDTAAAIRAGMRDASVSRSVMIARTELVGAVNGGSLAATQIVEQETGTGYVKKWLTAPGAPFPRHDLVEGLNGQTQPLDGYFDVSGSQLQFPGDPDGDPGEVINCFPGSTSVVTDNARVGYRRWYRGSLISVEAEGGRELSGTPNHPILTSAGWKPLAGLHKGDYLVCGSLRQRVLAGRPRPDVDHAPAAIEQVVRTLAGRGEASRVSGRPMQFHGDGTEGEVEVVTSDRGLRLDVEAASSKPSRELALVGADEIESLSPPSRPPGQVILSADHAAHGFMGGGGEPRPLLRTGLPHPLTHRRGAPASLDAHLGEPESDHVPADAIALGERLLGDAFEVTLAKVIEIEEQPFHGEVFNLQTDSGVYLAAGVIVHNCRCALVYDTPEGQQEGDAESGIDLPAPGEGDGGGDGGGSAGAADAVAALGFSAPSEAGAGAAGDELASAALIEPVTLGRADGGPEVRDALKAIDSVHRLPPLDSMPVPVRAGRDLGDGVGARLVSHREGSIVVPDAIDVNPNGTRIELDFAHEVGHALDYSLFRSDTLKVVDAAKQTDAYKALGWFGNERSAYLLRDREVFARAYAQWIAERSGNAQMLAQVADVVRGAADFGLTPDQWTASDFAPVRAALDRIFADRGLLDPAATRAAEPALEPPVAALPARPAGLEPGSILSIQGGTRGALVQQRAEIESAISDLDKLVRLPGRSNLGDDVKVTMRKNRTSRGHMKFVNRGGKGIPIEINVGSDRHAAVTLAHEYGHLLDLSYLAEPGVFATRQLGAATAEGTRIGDALRNLDAAWKESEAYRTLQASGMQMGRYYTSRSELWARSFAQWAAGKSEAGALKEQIAKEVSSETLMATEFADVPGWRFYPEMWQPDDFTPVAAAVEQVLRAAGLLKEAPPA